MKKSCYAMLADEPMEFSDSTEYELDPQEYGDEQIIAQLTKYSEAGRAYSDQVLDCRVFSSYQKCSKLFLSKNRDMEQNILWTCGGLVVMATRGEEIKADFTVNFVMFQKRHWQQSLFDRRHNIINQFFRNLIE